MEGEQGNSQNSFKKEDDINRNKWLNYVFITLIVVTFIIAIFYALCCYKVLF